MEKDEDKRLSKAKKWVLDNQGEIAESVKYSGGFDIEKIACLRLDSLEGYNENIIEVSFLPYFGGSSLSFKMHTKDMMDLVERFVDVLELEDGVLEMLERLYGRAALGREE